MTGEQALAECAMVGVEFRRRSWCDERDEHYSAAVYCDHTLAFSVGIGTHNVTMNNYAQSPVNAVILRLAVAHHHRQHVGARR